MGIDASIALYWDFQNLCTGTEGWKDEIETGGEADAERKPLVPAIDVGRIVSFVASTVGPVAINRAYADWRREGGGYADVLMRHAVDPVQHFNVKGKNGADIRLVADVIDDLYRHPFLTHVVVVTGDSDFVPLAHKVRTLGRQVIGIARSGSTSWSWQRACDVFVTYESILARAANRRTQTPTRPASTRPAGQSKPGAPGTASGNGTAAAASTPTKVSRPQARPTPTPTPAPAAAAAPAAVGAKPAPAAEPVRPAAAVVPVEPAPVPVVEPAERTAAADAATLIEPVGATDTATNVEPAGAEASPAPAEPTARVETTQTVEPVAMAGPTATTEAVVTAEPVATGEPVAPEVFDEAPLDPVETLRAALDRSMALPRGEGFEEVLRRLVQAWPADGTAAEDALEPVLTHAAGKAYRTAGTLKSVLNSARVILRPGPDQPWALASRELPSLASLMVARALGLLSRSSSVPPREVLATLLFGADRADAWLELVGDHYAGTPRRLRRAPGLATAYRRLTLDPPSFPAADPAYALASWLGMALGDPGLLADVQALCEDLLAHAPDLAVGAAPAVLAEAEAAVVALIDLEDEAGLRLHHLLENYGALRAGQTEGTIALAGSPAEVRRTVEEAVRVEAEARLRRPVAADDLERVLAFAYGPDGNDLSESDGPLTAAAAAPATAPEPAPAEPAPPSGEPLRFEFLAVEPAPVAPPAPVATVAPEPVPIEPLAVAEPEPVAIEPMVVAEPEPIAAEAIVATEPLVTIEPMAIEPVIGFEPVAEPVAFERFVEAPEVPSLEAAAAEAPAVEVAAGPMGAPLVSFSPVDGGIVVEATAEAVVVRDLTAVAGPHEPVATDSFGAAPTAPAEEHAMAEPFAAAERVAAPMAPPTAFAAPAPLPPPVGLVLPAPLPPPVDDRR